MDTNQKKSIVDICDRLIEDAQNVLINQMEYSNKITLKLSDYADAETSETIGKDITEYLMLQEIRLYEDECDENGMIVNSKEIVAKIFENVSIETDNNLAIINLFYSKGMMELLF